MTIASEISRLQSAKANIKTAIEWKGVTVPSAATLDWYDDYITAIEQKWYNGPFINLDMQWPAPSWFHVPLTTEWQWLKTIMNSLSLTKWDNWRVNLHMPFAGYRDYSTANIGSQGSVGSYWSSSSYNSVARGFYLDSSNVSADSNYYRTYGYAVRCFKNSFEKPTSSWTVIRGTLWSAWIFWNQTEWLISITSNWTTWYTIQDKNLWATTVYNDGDTLTQANMGNKYQWWNNYWFPSTWNVTTSSSQVNAQNYWPWNYYSSSTFIKGNSSQYDWSSVKNDNLRWWVSQWSEEYVTINWTNYYKQ